MKDRVIKMVGRPCMFCGEWIDPEGPPHNYAGHTKPNVEKALETMAKQLEELRKEHDPK